MSHSSTLPTEILEAAGAGAPAVMRAVAAAGGAPLQDGVATTFLYFGEAEEVGLHHWMDIFPVLPRFRRHDGTSLWSLTINLPERSRIEYKISVKRDGRRRVLLDHLNPQRALDPFGANSVVTGPLYGRPSWSLPRPDIAAGSVEEIAVVSRAFGDTWQVPLYLPAGLQPGPLPLLIAHDGSEYDKFAALTVVLDNLIADGEIPPLACAMSNPGARSTEYTGDSRHAEHLVRELIPAVAAHVELDGTHRVALGASFGGVASLHVSWRYPGTLSGLILQSGSFVTSLGGRHRRGAVFAPVVAFMADFNAEPRELPGRIHMSCGRFDGLVAENRVMAARLADEGADVGYDEVADGHNWENWRDRLRAGLVHVFAR